MHTAVVRDDTINGLEPELDDSESETGRQFELCFVSLCFPCLKFYGKSLFPFDEHSVSIIIFVLYMYYI